MPTATIAKASGVVICRHVNLVDSAATGGATFYAGQATNGGGNSGWLFTDAVATGTGAGTGTATGTRTVYGIATGAGTGTGTATGTVPSARRSNFNLFRLRGSPLLGPEVPFDEVARWARRG